MKFIHSVMIGIGSMSALLAGTQALGQTPEFVAERVSVIRSDYQGTPIGYGTLAFKRTADTPESEEQRLWVMWFDPKTQRLRVDVEHIASLELIGDLATRNHWDIELANDAMRFSIASMSKLGRRTDKLDLLEIWLDNLEAAEVADVTITSTL